jgi:cardiolipin synthase A/B
MIGWIAGGLIGAALLVIVANLWLRGDQIRHRIEPLYGAEDPEFRRAISTLLGPTLLEGNRVTALYNGDAIFPAMLDAIGTARRTITFETFIYWKGEIGRRFAEALAERARAGVRVHVLLDWVGTQKIDDESIEMMKAAGVEVCRYRPLHWWNLHRVNNRTHRKILVVDGRIGFTGGINIREGHWLALDPRHPVRDLHFRLEGPVVAELQEVFAEDWTFATGELLEGERWFPGLDAAGGTVARGVSDGPDIDFEVLPSILLSALGAARESVRIATPYFIPDPNLITALNLAALRGVSVEILLPEKNNLALVQWASTAYWPQLLDKGCRIFLSPAPFDHSKLMVVDGAWTLLGSANWDPRSLLLNFEFNVECFDPVFGARMDD